MYSWDILLSKIFKHPSLIYNPPVLFDIGASGEIYNEWKDIAKYSICIAFDADDREMSFTAKEESNYKKLIIINRIVVSGDEKECRFYLTSSPYCSSSLKPDLANLKEWSFSELFNIEKEVILKTVHLKTILTELKIDNVDWFKADAQGIDLQLFNSIDAYHHNIIVADFEPGFIDAILRRR